MSSVNKVMIMGNLTRDPELRVTPKGTAICQFGVAMNRKFKDEAGNEREEVVFVDIEAWGKRGEVIAKYFNKGGQIFIEGRLKFDSWEDKATGQKRSKLKVVMEDFQFTGQGGGNGGGRGEGSQDDADDRGAGAQGRAGQRDEGRGGFGGRQEARKPAQENLDEDVPF